MYHQGEKMKNEMTPQEQIEYDLFVTKLITYFGLFSYLCFGLYWFYPEVLNMLFWPFHYGWFAH